MGRGGGSKWLQRANPKISELTRLLLSPNHLCRTSSKRGGPPQQCAQGNGTSRSRRCTSSSSSKLFDGLEADVDRDVCNKQHDERMRDRASWACAAASSSPMGKALVPPVGCTSCLLPEQPHLPLPLECTQRKNKPLNHSHFLTWAAPRRSPAYRLRIGIHMDRCDWS